MVTFFGIKEGIGGIVVFGYFLWHQRKYWQEEIVGLWLLSLASKKVLAGIVVFGYFLWHQRK
ncbi:MAG: hypothetical protein U5L01_08285 [Rheinheimera sp.]|nr:hypothetical protein [Rheinheimera sp.]